MKRNVTLLLTTEINILRPIIIMKPACSGNKNTNENYFQTCLVPSDLKQKNYLLMKRTFLITALILAVTSADSKCAGAEQGGDYNPEGSTGLCSSEQQDDDILKI